MNNKYFNIKILLSRSIFYITVFFASITISLFYLNNDHFDTDQKKDKLYIRKKIETMDVKEKEYLSNFFRFTFFLSGFGYAIYGDKPMSFETINLREEPKNIDGFDYMDIQHIFDKYRLRDGWEVWNKHFKTYSSNNFTLSSRSFSLDRNQIEITLINHQNFIKIVTENLNDFQKILGKDLTPQQILEAYIEDENPISTVIRQHDGLFGILLGYGRDNSFEYMNQKGGEQLNESFQDFEPTGVESILPPSFCVIENTQETDQLRSSYENCKKKIDSIFQQTDFLEQVLNELCLSKN